MMALYLLLFVSLRALDHLHQNLFVHSAVNLWTALRCMHPCMPWACSMAHVSRLYLESVLVLREEGIWLVVWFIEHR